MTISDLKSCRSAALAAQSIQRRIKDIQCQKDGIRSVRYSDSPHIQGTPLQWQQHYIEALEELCAEYEETIARWARKAAHIERAIRKIPPDLGEMIRLRYVDGLKWERVNEQLYISHMTSVRMHQKAMKLLLDK